MVASNLSRSSALSISAVERDTGLTKDTLRVWERRYGFPSPERAGSAQRAYPAEQVEKLKVIKRLMDAGHRPGQIVAQPLDVLRRLSDAVRSVASPLEAAADEASDAAAPDAKSYLDLIRSHDVDRLHRVLQQAQLRLGVERFLSELIVPLNTLVGDTWMRGHLEIFEEHLYTECLQGVLRGALAQMSASPPSARPCVLLTTFPTETHGMALLMAQLLLRLEGCRCISLGVQTPLWDTVLAASSQRADVVALSFTAVMSPSVVTQGLVELRGKLPHTTEIWAGGGAPVLHRRPTPGVRPVRTLAKLADEVQRWRAERL